MTCFYSVLKALLLMMIFASVFLLQHITQAYCIYNEMNDDTSFYIRDSVVTGSSFKQTLEHNGDKECCPYSNTDCNSSRERNKLIEFDVQFTFQSDTDGEDPVTTDFFYTNCTAGGALTFFGSAKNYFGTCVFPGGSQRRVVLEPYSKDGSRIATLPDPPSNDDDD